MGIGVISYVTIAAPGGVDWGRGTTEGWMGGRLGVYYGHGSYP